LVAQKNSQKAEKKEMTKRKREQMVQEEGGRKEKI